MALILAWISFFILTFMFITSFQSIQRKIKKWKVLHKLIYLVLFLAIARMLMIEKGKQIRSFGKLQLYFAIFSFIMLTISYLIILFKSKKDINF